MNQINLITPRSPGTGQQSRQVSLNSLLSNGYKRNSCDYIEVNVVHSFLFMAKSKIVHCHFIFADHEAHISAILFHRPVSLDQEAPRVFQQLKEGTRHRIKYFEIIPNLKQPLLRHQTRRLKLRNCDNDIEQIFEIVNSPLLKHIPFEFTNLEDFYQHRDKLNDLLGYVKNVEHKVTSRCERPYQVIEFVRNCPSLLDSPVTDEHQHIYVASWHLAKETFKLGCLYAISNVLVRPPDCYPLDIITTASSVVVKVTQGTIQKILGNLDEPGSLAMLISDFDQYIGQPECDEIWSDDDDDFLSRVLSQTAKLGEESAPTNISAEPQLMPIAKAPFSNLVPASTDPPVCISPAKRTLPMNTTTLNSSPTKKVKQIPSRSANLQGDPTRCTKKLKTPQEYYDCISKDFPYDVVVTPSSVYMDTYPGCYSMRSKVRGMGLIIHNVFSGTSREREGSYFDVMYLTEYLRKCNFNVTTATDVTSLNFRSTIQAFKKKIVDFGPENFDSLFIAVLSHGVHGAVEMTDEITVPIFNDLIHPFDEYSFPCLAGKPKIFLVNTCQGLPSLNVIRLQRNVMTPPEKTTMKNMIICYSAFPGSASYRDRFLGSYFIYVLVDILMKHSHNTHFEKILRMVQDALQKVIWDLNQELICSWTPFRFDKMYFNPGL